MVQVLFPAWEFYHNRTDCVPCYQGLPYDAAVEQCLSILQEHFPDEVEVPDPT